MPRAALTFVCQSCGAAHPKWSGRCDDCGAWNTLVEEQAAPPAGTSAKRTGKGRPFVLEGLSSISAEPPRRHTRIAEFDRVAGGGLVPGSALLLGGDPGVGKSTLVLHVLAAYARPNRAAV
jgi:DNA repair protein RadA/Sms